MTDYQLNQYYTFKVTDISGNRIFLEDENHKKYSVYGYDFQTKWDSASPQVAMGLKCFVKDIEEEGSGLKLEQSRLDILHHLYPTVGKEYKAYTFIVKDLRMSHKDEVLLIVRDAFGLTHIYKPTEKNKKLLNGDEVELYVTGIQENKGNNRSKLLLTEEMPKPLKSVNTQVIISSDEADEVVIGEFGEETDTLEFKSSIIYPAKAIDRKSVV